MISIHLPSLDQQLIGLLYVYVKNQKYVHISSAHNPISDTDIAHFIHIQCTLCPFEELCYVDIANDQEAIWRETLDQDSSTEAEVRRGGLTPTNVNQKLLHDIQALLGRLVGKVKQLLSNDTTNLAENWMNVHAKFDGGKVINRSQSGSWQHRCMGAGLRHNLGPTWGPVTWEGKTGSPPNKVFTNAAENSAKILEQNRKRKATEEAKEKRRRSKYTKLGDNSVAARRAYSRHDDGILPDEVMDNITPEELEEKKTQWFQTHVVLTTEAASEIEQQTRNQSDSDKWRAERRKRLTASRTGRIIKMRPKTKRSKRVEEFLYSVFKGNKATNYGSEKEEITRQEYISYQKKNKPTLTVEECGLYISSDNNWLAATPDGVVHDNTDVAHPIGLLEIKNPYTMKDKNLVEASKVSSFCLKSNDNNMLTLKRNHDYYYQIQCQLYCVDLHWCDFVVRTNRDMHVERIRRDTQWWDSHLPKFRKFYFDALLPELAEPRHTRGGIREPL